jgi:tetratricopeptide (TPR) repeat protein
MIRHAIGILLFVAGISMDAAPLYAQCAPRPELEARLKRAAADDAAMECLGRLLLEQGQSAGAVDWLEKAVAVNGQSAAHHMWLGHALREQTQTASMLRQPFLARRMKAEYEQAVALDPTLVDPRHWLVMFNINAPSTMGGSIAKAREQAAAILKLDPMRGHVEYATIAEQEKDFPVAEKELLAAMAAGPDSATPYEATGSFYRRQQRWSDAIAIYEKLLKTKPDAINAHLSLGRVYINNLKEYERGEKEVRLWLAAQPKDASIVNISNAHYCLGVVHQQGGRRDQARAEYQIALSANPKNEDAKKAMASLK